MHMLLNVLPFIIFVPIAVLWWRRYRAIGTGGFKFKEWFRGWVISMIIVLIILAVIVITRGHLFPLPGSN